MTAPTIEWNAAEIRFIAALSELERGPLAELRRSLSYRSGQSFFLERLIYDHLPKYRSRTSRNAAYLVAGLYALVERPHSEVKGKPDAGPVEEQPNPAAPRNLGHALGSLYHAQENRPSTEKRFLALLDADEDQLADRLRHVVTLLDAGGIRPEWAQLLSDVVGWGRPESRDRTREQWARAFYRPEFKSTEITAEPITTQEEPE